MAKFFLVGVTCPHYDSRAHPSSVPAAISLFNITTIRGHAMHGRYALYIPHITREHARCRQYQCSPLSFFIVLLLSRCFFLLSKFLSFLSNRAIIFNSLNRFFFTIYFTYNVIHLNFKKLHDTFKKLCCFLPLFNSLDSPRSPCALIL